MPVALDEETIEEERVDVEGRKVVLVVVVVAAAVVMVVDMQQPRQIVDLKQVQ